MITVTFLLTALAAALLAGLAGLVWVAISSLFERDPSGAAPPTASTSTRCPSDSPTATSSRCRTT